MSEMKAAIEPKATTGHGRNIGLLAAAQAIVGSQQTLVAAIGALIGISMAPDPRLATVPITMMVLGLALTAGPAAMLVHRLGRTRAFMLGAMIAIVAALLAAMAIALHNFYVFCIALVFVGASSAFGQQYRFAVADSVPPVMKGKAVSWVLAGGVMAGFIGPALSIHGRGLVPGANYAGSFLMMAGLAAIGVAILSQTRLARTVMAAPKETRRKLGTILRDADLFIPIITSMVSYGLMNMVMVAAPLAMVVICGHSEAAATTAIQWHVIAMFGPSFFTGYVIAKIGVRLTIGLGMALILGCCITALSGVETWHFDIALVLLGLGWNFGFIGSTALLAQTYRPEESGRVQAVNEQLVFGTMAVASISSGVLLQTIGWQAVNIIAIPIATAAIALLAWGDWRSRKSVAA